jgi:hypothetical protein
LAVPAGIAAIEGIYTLLFAHLAALAIIWGIYTLLFSLLAGFAAI